jgi:hypothetical protein
MIFKPDLGNGSTKFTKQILKKRLAFFSPFFQEILPLKDRPSVLSLRYKAVSQYASENSIFAFLTQYVEAKKLEGQEPDSDMVHKIQETFQMSAMDARRVIEEWFQKEGTLSVTVPEENEFMKSFNPGIDIHIYGVHPSFTIHVDRVDSYKTFQRLYSLLCVLFLEDQEGLFRGGEAAAGTFTALASTVEKKSLKDEKVPVLDEDEEEDAKSTVSGAEAIIDPTSVLHSFRPPEESDEEAESEPEPEPEKKSKKSTKSTKSSKKAEETGEDTGHIVPQSWHLNRLKEADADIFKPPYSKRCGAVDERHPAVLDRAQFEAMLAEFQPEVDNGTLFFNIFPLQKGKTEKEAGRGGIPHDAKQITITRYGSTLAKENYYFCPELFCLFDRKMVLESDFDAKVDREGNRKERFTCPWCKGTEIIDHERGAPGQTVFRRILKEGSDKAHLFIGFVGKSGLPCCHVLKKTLRIMDPEFERLRSIKIDADRGTYLDAEVVGEADAVEEDERQSRDRSKKIRKTVADLESRGYKASVNYEVEFNRVYQAYIVDENKHPLEPGKVAILPPVFDTYFMQNSANIVKRSRIKSQLVSKTRGFLRIGPEIGPLTAKCDTPPKPVESLLGVLAPLLYEDTIEDARKLLLDAVTGDAGVLVFVNANFGNLVNEFYVPSDPDIEPAKTLETITDNSKADIPTVLKDWARDHLHITANEFNEHPIRRIYKSYNRFVEFLRDPLQRKDLRHLTSFLTEPNLISTNRRGLHIVVLEWSKGQEAVTVRCAPYGYSRQLHAEDDFAFVWRDADGYYELLFYVENSPGQQGTVMRWKIKNKATWPRIIQDRINEYMSQCQSQHKSIFTSQMDIDAESLIPLSVALTKPITVVYREKPYQVLPYGIVRDSYNHAVFVVYPVKPKSPTYESEMVAMPVVDDGYFSTDFELYLDVQGFTPAPADKVVHFYVNFLRPVFSIYPGYQIQHMVRRKIGKGSVRGIQLENNVFIPTADASEGSDVSAFSDTTRKVDEWDMNRDLAKPCESSAIKDSTQKQLEELYQYFRFMVSNWLAKDAGEEITTAIERIVFDSKLPDYEKRKRLEILCGNFKRREDGEIYEEEGWLTWMKPTEEDWDMPSGLLRKNCRVLDEKSCTGACVWKREEGVCALHVTEETEIRSKGGPTMVNTRVLFSRRVIDELVYFPKRRKELLEQRVSKMSVIVAPIREGDQYIIPERGMSWLSLLRLDWRPQDKEVPLHYEEMASEEGETKGVAEMRLPSDVDALVGSKTPYRFWISSEGIKGLATILGVSVKEVGAEEALMRAYVKKMGRSLGVIDVRTEVPSIRFVKGSDLKEVPVLVFRKDQMGLLMESDGKPLITVAGLDGALLDAWDSSVVEKPKTGLRRVAFAGLRPSASESAKPAPTPAPPLKRVETVVASAPPKQTTLPKTGLPPADKEVVVPPKETSASPDVESEEIYVPPANETFAKATSANPPTVAPPSAIEEKSPPFSSSSSIAPPPSAIEEENQPFFSSSSIALPAVTKKASIAPPSAIKEESPPFSSSSSIALPAVTKKASVAPPSATAESANVEEEENKPFFSSSSSALPAVAPPPATANVKEENKPSSSGAPSLLASLSAAVFGAPKPASLQSPQAPPSASESLAPPSASVRAQAPPSASVQAQAPPSASVQAQAPPSVSVRAQAPPSASVQAQAPLRRASVAVNSNSSTEVSSNSSGSTKIASTSSNNTKVESSESNASKASTSS